MTDSFLASGLLVGSSLLLLVFEELLSPGTVRTTFLVAKNPFLGKSRTSLFDNCRLVPVSEEEDIVII